MRVSRLAWALATAWAEGPWEAEALIGVGVAVSSRGTRARTWLRWVVREALRAHSERPNAATLARTIEVHLLEVAARTPELFTWRFSLEIADELVPYAEKLQRPGLSPAGDDPAWLELFDACEEIGVGMPDEGDPSWPRVVQWPTPPIPLAVRPSTVGALIALLDIDPVEADWLADVRSWNRRDRDRRLDHYHRTWIEKRSGGRRLIEAPKPHLRRAQRALLDRVLVGLPTHDAAYGFVRGRSARDHARVHAGRAVVLRMDLRDFFPSVTATRVAGVLRAAGLSSNVARFAAGLATTWTPPSFSNEPSLPPHTRLCLRGRHLPMGAPSSPALANACVFSLDRRLAGLARAFDGRYSRYADDLAFSGDEAFARRIAVFRRAVERIVREEGFVPHEGKTEVRRRGQGQRVTGLVVDEGAAVPRRERELLEAILFNCVRHGPRSQCRGRTVEELRAHLRGHVAHVAFVRPRHAEKLSALFERIDWNA